ncbi:MAG: TauD/TfdA family dioxygenase, partial [Myxococcota bacterium]
YISGLMQTEQYREYLDAVTMKLTEQENAIQGPHVEAGFMPKRAGFLVLYCEAAEEMSADTGIYDLAASLSELPACEQKKYKAAKNQFRFRTRELNWWERTFGAWVAGKVVGANLDQNGKFARRTEFVFERGPTVVHHPRTGIPCIQPWPFTNNTAMAVHRAAIDTFHDRHFADMDSTASSGDSVWNLVDDLGTQLGWSEPEMMGLFKSIFKTTYAHRWEVGDVLLVDNIRCGHGRMEGPKTRRSLLQLQCNYVDITTMR